MAEVIVFKTGQHTWCVPTSEVYVRRGSGTDNCGIRFLSDSFGGERVGSTTCYDVAKSQIMVFSSMEAALNDPFYWS